MVLGEAIAGAAMGAHSLFGYNRENFFFDREMRQKQEFKILEWRNKQAELWRDDVRDIVGLTEKKMDSYLIVATLQLGMCCALFSEGRLEPGTPPWLLHFYMLTLGAAFMYLMMSVWFAMHASVVASCSSVRLLTQFVRLPVPTWQQLEDIRTYAETFETLDTDRILRVPFAGNAVKAVRGGSASSTPVAAARGSGDSCPSSASPLAKGTVDPWRKEFDGGTREDLYELREKPAALRRHIGLARKAAQQYQGYDAFARVAMSFGTTQLVFAVLYYVLGYVAIQDGAPWPAWSISAIMIGIALTIAQLDFSLTRKEQRLVQVLIVTGPVCAAGATLAWIQPTANSPMILLSLLPIVYASHGLHLFFSLIACGLELQSNGALLPMKFRAVLYLDVFGWLVKNDAGRQGKDDRPGGQYQRLACAPAELPMTTYEEPPQPPDDREARTLARLRGELRADVELWESEQVQRFMDEPDRARAGRVLKEAKAAIGSRPQSPVAKAAQKVDLQSPPRGRKTPRRLAKLRGCTDFGTEVPYFYDPANGEVLPEVSERPEDGMEGRSLTCMEEDLAQFIDRAAKRAALPVMKTFKEQEEPAEVQGARSLEVSWRQGNNPSGEVLHAPGYAFSPASYTGLGLKAAPTGDEDEIVTGHDRMQPGKLPANIFRLSTMLLALLWAVGLMMPFGVYRGWLMKPMISHGGLEDARGHDRGAPGMMPTPLVGGSDGPLELVADHDQKGTLPMLPESEIIGVEWPSHAGFVPRALSSDPSGANLVVADDFGVYAGRIAKRGPQADAGNLTIRALSAAAAVDFKSIPPCAALDGQSLRDIGIVCAKNPQTCGVAVLHHNGQRVSECPLVASSPMTAGAKQRRASVADEDDEEEDGAPDAAMTWKISGDWLDHHTGQKQEYVESVALDSGCLHTDVLEGDLNARGAGCVVVGTSSGRLVQLREASNKRRNLVPVRVMQQGVAAVGRGSLHVLPNGMVISLQHGSQSVQAYDSRQGSSIGEWALPGDIHWLMLCGAADSLYALGLHGKHNDLQLHQFPMPKELQGVPARTPPSPKVWRLRGTVAAGAAAGEA